MKDYPQLIEVRMRPATLRVFLALFAYLTGKEVAEKLECSLSVYDQVYADWDILGDQLADLMGHESYLSLSTGAEWDKYDGD